MRIKLSTGGAKQEEKPEQNEEQKIKAELGGKKVSCRICSGDHFTARCPYKDTLGEADGEFDGSSSPMPPCARPSSYLAERGFRSAATAAC